MRILEKFGLVKMHVWTCWNSVLVTLRSLTCSVLLSNFKTIVIIIVLFSSISTWSSWSLHLRHDCSHQSCPILVQVSPDLVPAKVSKLIWNNRRTNKAFPWNKEASQFGTVEEQTRRFLGIIERSNSFFLIWNKNKTWNNRRTNEAFPWNNLKKRLFFYNLKQYKTVSSE